MTLGKRSEKYDDYYIEQVFYLWHKNGRKISDKFAKSLPLDEKGQQPAFKTIEQWRDKFGWVTRADSLDSEISTALQEKVIDERIKMYEEHTALADTLIEKARTFLASTPIDEMKDALKAIELAVEIQRTSIGQAEFGRRLLTMSNEQLSQQLNKLLQPKQENEFIDAETLEDSE